MAGLIRLLDNTIASDAAIQKVAVRLDLPEQDYRRQVARTPIVESMDTRSGRSWNVPSGESNPGCEFR